jgi:hypothetical protein
MVVNHCGTPFYFTIGGTMYEVGGNATQPIELSPGEYNYTISKPGFRDINGTLRLEAPKVYTFPVTCEVR